jgi:hypothetical protein
MAIARQMVFGIAPTQGAFLPVTYSWPLVADGNSSQAYLSCAYAPRGSGTGLRPLQDTLLLGTVNAAATMHTFDTKLSKDGSTSYKSVAITQRIDPTRVTDGVSDTKRFTSLQFVGVNPFDKGAKVSVCYEQVDPTTNAANWTDLQVSSGDTKASVPSGVARWLNVKIEDDTDDCLHPTFSGFMVYFYRLFSREKA